DTGEQSSLPAHHGSRLAAPAVGPQHLHRVLGIPAPGPEDHCVRAPTQFRTDLHTGEAEAGNTRWGRHRRRGRARRHHLLPTTAVRKRWRPARALSSLRNARALPTSLICTPPSHAAKKLCSTHRVVHPIGTWWSICDYRFGCSSVAVAFRPG